MSVLHDYCKRGTEHQLEIILNEISGGYEERLEILLGQKNDLKYTPLHLAIFERNIIAVKLFLDKGADCNTKCHGTPPLHLALRTAAQPDGREFGFECFRELMKCPTIAVSAKDDNNMTVLHLMAQYDYAELVSEVLSVTDGQQLVNSWSQATGLSPLHCAALNNSVATARLLILAGATLDKKLAVCHSTPLHCAATLKNKEVFELLVELGSLLTERDVAGHTPVDIIEHDGWKYHKTTHKLVAPDELNRMTTVLYADVCSEHHTCLPSDLRTNNAPPENVHRLHVLIHPQDGVLKSRSLTNMGVQYALQEEKCALSDVLRVHEWSYVRRVQSKCESIDENVFAANGLDSLDGDTTLSHKTFDAALTAAGAVCNAVDRVVGGYSRNAFCAVRPPGHHAGPLGSVKAENGSESHGFCFLNNVSIGAAYAMNKHRGKINRVAIVDFDVHHGNGTEETIKWLKPFVTEQEFANDNGFGKMYTPRFKPWFSGHDSENVLFVSVHGYGPRQQGLEAYFPQSAFYPGSGPTTIPDVVGPNCPKLPPARFPSPPVDASNSNHVPEDPSMEEEVEECENEVAHILHGDLDDEDDDDDDDVDAEEGSAVSKSVASSSNVVRGLLDMYRGPSLEEPNAFAPSLVLDIGVPLCYTKHTTPLGKLTADTEYRFQWRNYFRDVIFPRLVKFQPDLIMISAGFDAHKKDTINAGYISLIEEDFQWVTEKLVEIANTHSEGRIVSVLEGGYQLGGEYSSAFAKSVLSHVQALAHGCKSDKHFDARKTALEAEQEAKILLAMAKKRDADIALRLQAAKDLEEQLCAARAADDRAQGEDMEKSEEDLGSRKRRRPQVDYVALDKELVGSK